MGQMYGTTRPLPFMHQLSFIPEPGRKEAIAQSKKKPIKPSDFYLGPIPFNTQFPKPKALAAPWLVDHWPKKRQELRRQMLAEVTGR